MCHRQGQSGLPEVQASRLGHQVAHGPDDGLVVPLLPRIATLALIVTRALHHRKDLVHGRICRMFRRRKGVRTVRLDDIDPSRNRTFSYLPLLSEEAAARLCLPGGRRDSGPSSETLSKVALLALDHDLATATNVEHTTPAKRRASATTLCRTRDFFAQRESRVYVGLFLSHLSPG